MDRGAWRAAVHGVLEGRTGLSTQAHMDVMFGLLQFRLSHQTPSLICSSHVQVGWSFICVMASAYVYKDASIHIPEKAVAPHSSTLAWKIPWMEEPGGLQSMRSQSWT